ncbi:hypothetical protein BGX27_005374 [Mortierella sp. AM989]|nr:hypothetical protein BGX27_005374 [Mortierella sp. AM989]
MNDHYNVNVDIERDSIYGKKPNPQEGFRRYLRLAETRNGLLPSWWSQEKAVECVDFSTKNQWSSLENPIGKDDVREHYEHPFMTLQLRLFGQQVYGRGPGGNDGYKVLQIQLIAEEEGVYILPKDESHRIPRK